MISEANMPSPAVEAGRDLATDAGQPESLKIGGFNNF
jgi:hypothetical protein